MLQILSRKSSHAKNNIKEKTVIKTCSQSIERSIFESQFDNLVSYFYLTLNYTVYNQCYKISRNLGTLCN